MASSADNLLKLMIALVDVLVRQLVEGLVAGLGGHVSEVVHLVTSDSPSEVHVLLHHCHSVGVDSAQLGVLENSYQVSLG